MFKPKQKVRNNMKQRILRILIILVIIICTATAVSLLSAPNFADYAESVTSIRIEQEDTSAIITKTDQVSEILGHIKDQKLKSMSKTDITFPSDCINIRFMNGNEEIIFVTITNNKELPYLIIIEGKNYTIPKTVSAFDQSINKTLSKK